MIIIKVKFISKPPEKKGNPIRLGSLNSLSLS
jgi:hypothetical protein